MHYKHFFFNVLMFAGLGGSWLHAQSVTTSFAGLALVPGSQASAQCEFASPLKPIVDATGFTVDFNVTCPPQQNNATAKGTIRVDFIPTSLTGHQTFNGQAVALDKPLVVGASAIVSVTPPSTAGFTYPNSTLTVSGALFSEQCLKKGQGANGSETVSTTCTLNSLNRAVINNLNNGNPFEVVAIDYTFSVPNGSVVFGLTAEFNESTGTAADTISILEQLPDPAISILPDGPSPPFFATASYALNSAAQGDVSIQIRWPPNGPGKGAVLGFGDHSVPVPKGTGRVGDGTDLVIAPVPIAVLDTTLQLVAVLSDRVTGKTLATSDPVTYSFAKTTLTARLVCANESSSSPIPLSPEMSYYIGGACPPDPTNKSFFEALEVTYDTRGKGEIGLAVPFFPYARRVDQGAGTIILPLGIYGYPHNDHEVVVARFITDSGQVVLSNAINVGVEYIDFHASQTKPGCPSTMAYHEQNHCLFKGVVDGKPVVNVLQQQGSYAVFRPNVHLLRCIDGADDASLAGVIGDFGVCVDLGPQTVGKHTFLPTTTIAPGPKATPVTSVEFKFDPPALDGFKHVELFDTVATILLPNAGALDFLNGVQGTIQKAGKQITIVAGAGDFLSGANNPLRPAKQESLPRLVAAPAASPGGGYILANIGWTFSPSIPNDGSFAANLTFGYAPSNIPHDPNFVESQLQVVAYDPATDTLTPYPTTVDTVNHTASISVTSLAPAYSLAVFGQFTTETVGVPLAQESSTQVTLGVTNPGASSGTPVLIGYPASGVAVGAVASQSDTLAVAANHQSMGTIAQLAPNASSPVWMEAKSTPAGASVFALLNGSSGSFTASAGFSAGSPGLVISRVQMDSNTTTQFELLNPRDVPQAFAVSLRNQDGTEVGSYSAVLEPKAEIAADVTTIFPSVTAPFNGYALINSEMDVQATALLVSGKTSATIPGQIPAVFSNSAARLYSPYFTFGNYTTSRLNLVNPTTQSAAVTVQLYSASGSQIGNTISATIAPGALYSTPLAAAGAIGDPLSPITGVVLIQSSITGLAGDLRIGDAFPEPSDREIIPLSGTPQTGWLLPYVTDSSGMSSTISVSNSNSGSNSVTLTVYRADGTKAGTTTLNVPGNGGISGALSTLVPAAAGLVSGYATIQATNRVNAIVRLQPKNGGDSAILPGVPLTTASSGGNATPPRITAAVNGASFTPKLARGAWGTIQGDFTASQLTAGSSQLPTSLGGAAVTVGGVPTPIYYTQSGQVNFLVPREAPLGPAVPVVITVNGSPSLPVMVPIADYALGVFQYARTSSIIDPIIVHANNSIVTPDNPAVPNESVVIYANGIGKLNNPPATGTTSPFSPPSTSVDQPTITVGGSPATVQFAGMTPGIFGLAQLNIKLPASLPSGALPLGIQFPSDSSPTVNLYVQGNSSAAAPSIGVSPASLSFGNVPVGQSASLGLTISNSGNAALTVNSITSSNGLFSVASATSFTVQPGSSANATVRFSPTASGPQTGTLTLASNDPAHPSLAIALTGTGAGGATSTTLSVDGGIFNFEIGFPNTDNAVFVNRLTPPSYPATLTSVQIYFGNRSDGLALNVPITMVAATNPSGSASISTSSAGVLNLYAQKVVTLGAFNTYSLPTPITITSGDFVVGFLVSNPSGVFPADEDRITKSQGRSYVSSDAINFSVIDTFGASLAGNFGIRAIVTLGGSSTGSTALQ